MLQLFKKPRTCAHLLKENLAKYRVTKVSISHDKFRRKIKSHYDLFHVCDEKLSVVAMWFACWNLFYGILKKRISRRVYKEGSYESYYLLCEL